MTYSETAKLWSDKLAQNDPLYIELSGFMADKNENELEDRFYKELAFGTAGLRGKCGVGTNRMNRFTVGRATQGIADYIKLPHDLRAELKETMNTLVRGDKPIMGKPFYLAPELKDGAEESAASDYFSLGVMILRLLTQVWYMPGAQLDDMLMPLDPMWRTILPRLLRDKPAERECVPWRQAKSASPIRLLSGEANTQEIFLRIRFPHWVIGTILFIAACTFVALTILAALERGRYNAAQSEVERLTRIIMELKK